MREALSFAGGPLPEWCWLKAALPFSMGGLGLRWALFHAPAAYVGSLKQSHSLISSILGHPPATFSFLPGCISALSKAAKRPEWLFLQDVDVPIHQRALSKSIGLASNEILLDSAHDSPSRVLTLSSSIPHAGDWLSVIPSSALSIHPFPFVSKLAF